MIPRSDLAVNAESSKERGVNWTGKWGDGTRSGGMISDFFAIAPPSLRLKGCCICNVKRGVGGGACGHEYKPCPFASGLSLFFSLGSWREASIHSCTILLCSGWLGLFTVGGIVEAGDFGKGIVQASSGSLRGDHTAVIGVLLRAAAIWSKTGSLAAYAVL